MVAGGGTFAYVCAPRSLAKHEHSKLQSVKGISVISLNLHSTSRFRVCFPQGFFFPFLNNERLLHFVKFLRGKKNEVQRAAPSSRENHTRQRRARWSDAGGRCGIRCHGWAKTSPSRGTVLAHKKISSWRQCSSWSVFTFLHKFRVSFRILVKTKEAILQKLWILQLFWLYLQETRYALSIHFSNGTDFVLQSS